jgi:hypothetical protein
MSCIEILSIVGRALAKQARLHQQRNLSTGDGSLQDYCVFGRSGFFGQSRQTPCNRKIVQVTGHGEATRRPEGLSSLVSDLGLPVSITSGDLTLNRTGLVSELLAGL